MAAEDVDNQRIQAALDAALDELDSDSEGDHDETSPKRDERPAASTDQFQGGSSPEALLESFLEQMVVNGGEDELMGKMMGEIEAHLRSTVAQQELSGEIPAIAPSTSNAASEESSSQQPSPSAKRKHSCEPPPPRGDLDAVIGKLFEEIASEHEKLGKAAATEGANFQPPEGDDGMMQNLMKELEGLNTGSDLDTDAVIDGMMEQLLSKDLMYQPMRQVAERFPSWLEANKSKLSESEYAEREKQCACFQRLVALYESDPSNTTLIMDVMQEVQEYGQPPTEIIREIAPGIELDQDGLPKMEECSIM